MNDYDLYCKSVILLLSIQYTAPDPAFNICKYCMK